MSGPDANLGRNDSRLRVLWVIKGLGPGGAENLLVSAARVHDHDRYAISVAYLLPWKHAMVEPLRAAGVRVRCLEARGSSDLRWAARLRRYLLAERFDVVHLHSPMVAGVARLVVRTLPRATRPRVVTTEHNEWWSYVLPTRIANALTFPLDDAHLAVSEDVRRSVPAWLRRKVRTVVHGTSIADALAARAERVATRAELGFTPEDVVAVTVANFRAQKAYPDLLAAARIAITRAPCLRVVAVGQGPLEAEIRAEHLRLGLGDRFRFLGYREDALRVLAACDIFTLASHYEGYPVALMEALAVGLPVVATEVGGVPDAVRQGVEGIVVPPGRPDVLAGALADVANDPVRRAELAEAALRRGRQFDIAGAVRAIEATYDRIGR
jgi:glycosyltransferase involved in cell wall biosynthesis